MTVDRDPDTNEAYEIVPMKPEPHGPPGDWWTVTRNGIPDRHFSPSDLPLNFHPVAIRVSADFTPSGVDGATCDRRSWSGLRSRSPVAVNVAA